MPGLFIGCSPDAPHYAPADEDAVPANVFRNTDGDPFENTSEQYVCNDEE